MNIFKADAILALEFLQYLNSKETKASSAIDFALQLSKPIEFTYQVTRKLRRVGLINTTRGRKGGYAINSNVFNKMNMLQFYKSFKAVDNEVVSVTPITNLISRLETVLDSTLLKDVLQ